MAISLTLTPMMYDGQSMILQGSLVDKQNELKYTFVRSDVFIKLTMVKKQTEKCTNEFLKLSSALK